MYEGIYRSLPPFLQNAALSVKGYAINRGRYDYLFREAYNEMKSNHFTSKESLTSYQEDKFDNFLVNVSKNRLSLNRFEFLYGNISKFSTISDIKNIPLTTKEDIKKCIRKFPGKVDKDDLISHTSGTTGSGLVYPVTKMSDAFQWAVWWRYRNIHGIDFNTKCGYFGGRSIVSNGERKCFFRYNSAANQLMLSAYHLNIKNLHSYVLGLLKYKIRWLHGYPSFLSNFAGLCVESGVDLSEQIDIVTIGSESLLPSQEAIIKRAFNCRVVQHYGLSEGVVNISESACHDLVVDDDYSLVDFEELEKGRFKIIGTNFNNYSTPFVKYDTGDVASSLILKGHTRIVGSIDGRKEDSIILVDGTCVGRLDHIFKDIYQIKEVQIQQVSLTHLNILFVEGLDYDETVLDMIKNEFDIRLPLKVKLTFERVTSIPRTSTGKLRFVVSFLG